MSEDPVIIEVIIQAVMVLLPLQYCTVITSKISLGEDSSPPCARGWHEPILLVSVLGLKFSRV